MGNCFYIYHIKRNSARKRAMFNTASLRLMSQPWKPAGHEPDEPSREQPWSAAILAAATRRADGKDSLAGREAVGLLQGIERWQGMNE